MPSGARPGAGTDLPVTSLPLFHAPANLLAVTGRPTIEDPSGKFKLICFKFFPWYNSAESRGIERHGYVALALSPTASKSRMISRRRSLSSRNFDGFLTTPDYCPHELKAAGGRWNPEETSHLYRLPALAKEKRDEAT